MAWRILVAASILAHFRRWMRSLKDKSSGKSTRKKLFSLFCTSFASSSKYFNCFILKYKWLTSLEMAVFTLWYLKINYSTQFIIAAHFWLSKHGMSGIILIESGMIESWNLISCIPCACNVCKEHHCVLISLKVFISIVFEMRFFN